MRRHILTFVLLGVFTVSSMGSSCDPDPDTDPRALVVWDAVEQDGLVYAGGTYRYPENAAGSKLLYDTFLLILDASDPTAPVVVDRRDMKITQVAGIFGGRLIGVQPGWDEENLPGPGSSGSLTQQNVRVKVYDLTDPYDPQLQKTIELPGTAGRQPQRQVIALDSETILIADASLTSENPDGIPLFWVVKPGAPSGQELVATSPTTCSAPVVRGSRLWCLDNGGSGPNTAFGFDLPFPSGSVLPSVQAPLPSSWIASQAAVTQADDVIAVGSVIGARRLGFDATGLPSAAEAANFDRGEVSVLSAGAAGMLVQTTSAIRLVDSTSLTEISVLGYPGDPYSSHAGGAKLRPFPFAGSGHFIAAMGDYGVLFFRLNGTALEKVGGYYKRFGANWATDDDLQEGTY